MPKTRRHFRKSKAKQRRRRTRQLKGGAKIGKGHFGTVFRPPLLCKSEDPIDPKYQSDEYVGKVVDYAKALVELKDGQLLLGIDPEQTFALPGLVVCRLTDSQQNNTYIKSKNISEPAQLISKYGGETLGWYFQVDLLNSARGMLRVDKDRFLAGFNAFAPFLEGFRIFTHHFVHGDLHLNNIVWDGSRARMIDFGFLKSMEEKIVEEELNAAGGRDIYDPEQSYFTKEQIASIKVKARQQAACTDLELLCADLFEVLSSAYVTAQFPMLFKLAEAYSNDPRKWNVTPEFYYEFFDALKAVLTELHT